MNPVIENIKQRRSIRRYKDKKIPKKMINEIISAGMFAPSAHNSQQCMFIVITDRKVISKCSEFIKKWFKRRLIWKPIISVFDKKMLRTIESAEKRVFNEQDMFFYDAPVLVLVCAKGNKWAEKDSSCAAQNMMLAARSLGIGSCWIGYADHVMNKHRRMLAKLGVPSDMKVCSHIVFGYPDKFFDTAAPRKEDRVKWV